MSTALEDRLRCYLAERYPAAEISDFRFVASGWESDVYAFTLRLPAALPRAFILRLYPGDGAVEKLERESGGLRQLHRAEYPVPATLLHEADSAALGMPFTIIEKLEGRVLWPLLYQVDAAQADCLLDRFGGLVARLHRLDWRPFTDQAALYEADPTILLDALFASSRQLYTRWGVPGFLAIVDWLEAHKADVAVQPAVVHLDLHANNVFLCDDGHLAVIDWTQITVSDYRTDLTWTLMLMGDFGRPAWAGRILRAYTLAAGRPVENLDYFNVITYTKLLASTVISRNAGPEKLGMRPQTAASGKEGIPILLDLARRVCDITGITVPEVEMALGRNG